MTRRTLGKRGRTILVALEDVICMIAEDKYTTVIHESGKAVINDPLVDLEKRFPEQLMRVHRNALVAPGAIRGLEHVHPGSNFVVLEGTDFKPEISRRKVSAIRKYIRNIG